MFMKILAALVGLVLPHRQEIVKQIGRFPNAPHCFWAMVEAPDYIGGSNQYLKISVDGGTTWSALDAAPFQTFHSPFLAWDGVFGATGKYLVLAATSAAGNDDMFWKSTDGGATFVRQTGITGLIGDGTASLRYLTYFNSAWFLTQDDGCTPAVMRSADDGATWSSWWTSDPGYLFADATLGLFNLSVTGSDIYRSTDGDTNPLTGVYTIPAETGPHFPRPNCAVAINGIGVCAFASDPTNEDTSVHFSADGVTWEKGSLTGINRFDFEIPFSSNGREQKIVFDGNKLLFFTRNSAGTATPPTAVLESANGRDWVISPALHTLINETWGTGGSAQIDMDKVSCLAVDDT